MSILSSAFCFRNWKLTLLTTIYCCVTLPFSSLAIILLHIFGNLQHWIQWTCFTGWHKSNFCYQNKSETHIDELKLNFLDLPLQWSNSKYNDEWSKCHACKVDTRNCIDFLISRSIKVRVFCGNFTSRAEIIATSFQYVCANINVVIVFLRFTSWKYC